MTAAAAGSPATTAGVAAIAPDARIWVAGHGGLVGSAVCRDLAARGYRHVLTADRRAVDLRDRHAVDAFLAAACPEYVVVAAAKVGGIAANAARPADFIGDNLAIQHNVIDGSWRAGVRKLLFLGSSCIYPRDCPQPIREDYLLSGPLEPTNEWYAIAKIAGLKMCAAYRRQHGFNAICAMPTNLYGPGDNFDLETSHVLPALLRKAHEATRRGDAVLPVWGSGRPMREFLHVDDLADALHHLLAHYDDEGIVNVGTGEDVTIRDLALAICRVTGFAGELHLEDRRPDGTPRKLLDVSRMRSLGWSARIGLEEGLRQTYAWYCQHPANAG